MKKLFLIIGLLLFGLSYAQEVKEAVSPGTTPEKKNSFMLSFRGGYDVLPMYNTKAPYIKFKGGLEGGTSLDYYWDWFGLGFDFDYIQNKPVSTFPTENVYVRSYYDTHIGLVKITDWKLTEEKITRMFFGIGPDFKYENENFMTELNLRGGYGSIKGGEVILTGSTEQGDWDNLYNYYAGFDTHAISAKAQVRFTYFFNDMMGFHVGSYYLTHFKVQELTDRYEHVYSSIYTNLEERSDDLGDYYLVKNMDYIKSKKINISSLGIFAGITFKFAPKPKPVPIPPPVKKEVVTNIVVTAKDRFTEQTLPGADVVLKNEAGDILKTGTTNDFGVYVFENIKEGNYKIEGAWNEKALTPASVDKSEFKAGENIKKTLWYEDENFILKGKVVKCNTDIPLEDVTVVLEDKDNAVKKTTITDKDGKFTFYLKQKANYSLYGKKQKYFSQTEHISTADFDRSKTMFINLEICMDKADCGKPIRLNNILYDFDKYYIREDAKPELDKLVEFMKENSDVIVELSSHTDSRGSDAYNMRLSQKRAEAAVNYIISKGISPNRIKAVGYGESKLLNRCDDGVPCSEAEHQLNRRTEFKVICPKDPGFNKN